MNNRKKAWKCTAGRCLMNMWADIEICKRCKSYWRKKLPSLMIKHECPECGEVFVAGTNKTYCSRDCQKAAYRKRMRQWMTPKHKKPYEYRICAICGKEFYPRTDKQKTCGGRCSKEYLAKFYQRPKSEAERKLRHFMRERRKLEYKKKCQEEAEKKRLEEIRKQERLKAMLKLTDIAREPMKAKFTTNRPKGVEHTKKFLFQFGRYQHRGGDITGTAKTLDASISWWRKLDEPRQAALLNLALGIGTQEILAFRKLLLCLQQCLWADAKRAILFSKYGSKLGKRAVEMARQIETGEWQADPTRDIVLVRDDNDDGEW